MLEKSAHLILFLSVVALAFPFLACRKTAGDGRTPDPSKRADDWCLAFPQVQEEAAGVTMQKAMPASPPMCQPAMAPPKLGLATGGAKDVGNFRENIRNGYLPIPTDLTYEGLFYDYYFDQGPETPCQNLFCPTYAGALSRDPISNKEDLYLAVGLQSGLDASKFSRKKLNLVIVMDISGSMGSPFDAYYYDGGTRNPHAEEGGSKSKMEVAKESLVALIGHLKDDDRLGIVLFDDDAYLAKPLRFVGETDLEKLKKHIGEIGPRGGTNMEAGIRRGARLFDAVESPDPETTENRLVFLTDAMPNTGETEKGGLLDLTKGNADHRVFTTFVGVGVDFNTELVSGISKVRGCNYYSVHSAKEFRRRLDEEFDFMVTPLVFNLRLALESRGYQILEVYGSPEADQATGEVMKVATLFPSKSAEGKVKGGVVLMKLRRTGEAGTLNLKVSWEDRSGKKGESRQTVAIPPAGKEFFAHNGVRKAVLLSRYADMLLNWMKDERRSGGQGPKICSVTVAEGIPVPDLALGQWERTSRSLTVSPAYREAFAKFRAAFAREAEVLKDPDLRKELDTLDFLTGLKKPAKVTE